MFRPDPKPVKKVKLKKCRYCKQEFAPVRSLQVVCSPKCAATLEKEKTKKAEDKAWAKEKKVRKEKLKSYTQRLQEARKVF